MEHLALFQTREENLLDLTITTLPGQFNNISSPYKLSDQDTIMGTLKCNIPNKSKPKRTHFQYSKRHYDKMREDTTNFAKNKYFNGHQNERSIQENWKMIKNFIAETSKNNVPTKC